MLGVPAATEETPTPLGTYPVKTDAREHDYPDRYDLGLSLESPV